MKTRILVCVLAGVMGLSSVADACHKGAKNGKTSKATRGTVSSVAKNTMQLAVSDASGQHIFTVKYTPKTTIAGSKYHTINSTLVGSTVSVIGSGDGSTIKASEIILNG